VHAMIDKVQPRNVQHLFYYGSFVEMPGRKIRRHAKPPSLQY
jgi:hypothetical protein